MEEIIAKFLDREDSASYSLTAILLTLECQMIVVLGCQKEQLDLVCNASSRSVGHKSIQYHHDKAGNEKHRLTHLRFCP